MFDIEYKGGNTVIFSSKKSTLVVDPKLSVVGLGDLKIKDAIEISTEDRFSVNNPEARVKINGPGEYEVGEFSIHGVAAQRHIDTEEQGKLATIYRIENGDIRTAVLGNVDARLSDEQYEAIGVVDVLVLPVGGGGYTLDATSAASVVRSVEPKVVIPVHYADPALKYEVPQDTLETFCRELGAPVEQMAKLKVKSLAALPQTLTIIQLARS